MGEGGVGEDLTLGRGLAAGHEHLGEAGLVGEDPGAARPVVGDHRRDREPLAGVAAMAGRQDILHGQLAEPVVELEPAVHGPGHGPRVGRVQGDGPVRVGGHHVAGQARRGAAGGVEADQLAGRGVPDDGEEVTAGSAGDGLHERQRRVDGDGRIHGVATSFEDVDADLDRQGLRRRHHTVARVHHRPGGVHAPHGSIGRPSHSCHRQEYHPEPRCLTSHGHLPDSYLTPEDTLSPPATISGRFPASTPAPASASVTSVSDGVQRRRHRSARGVQRAAASHSRGTAAFESTARASGVPLSASSRGDPLRPRVARGRGMPGVATAGKAPIEGRSAVMSSWTTPEPVPGTPS